MLQAWQEVGGGCLWTGSFNHKARVNITARPGGWDPASRKTKKPSCFFFSRWYCSSAIPHHFVAERVV